MAAVPATKGADIEEPLRYITWSVVVVVLPTLRLGYFVIRLVNLPTLLGEIAPINLFPGATRSGLLRLS
jgi:hypothetical protein